MKPLTKALFVLFGLTLNSLIITANFLQVSSTIVEVSAMDSLVRDVIWNVIQCTFSAYILFLAMGGYQWVMKEE
jgi:hypothetical protein